MSNSFWHNGLLVYGALYLIGYGKIKDIALNAIDSRRSIFAAAPILALVSFIPSYFIARTVVFIIEVAGYSVDDALPSFELDGIMFFVAIVLGPLFETFLLAAGIFFIRKIHVNPWVVSLISGVVWSFFHGYQASLWALGTIWPFIVFSRAYLSWRSQGLSNAIGIAWISHSIHNALAVAVSYIP